MRSLLFCLLAGACLCIAQVRFQPEEIAVNIDGKPFTTFHYGGEALKPFLAPLRSASGKIVTRRYPMENIPGESRDHLHHKGMWIAYNDVNGIKFWEVDPSYTKPGTGRIAVRKAEYKDGDRSGTLTAVMEWRDPAGKVLLLQDSTMIFYADPKLRTIDVSAVLTAAADVTLGDTHDGLLAIRLAEPFTEKMGGKFVDAEGRSGMLQVWGKRANWVDYTAELEGERIGVAMFDNPKNPRYPTRWHARDYGLFSANPIADNVFDENQPETRLKLPKGQKLSFQWRVVIHPGDAVTGRVADLYKEYAAGH
jgi:methane monooxygenase PmoA-like